MDLLLHVGDEDRGRHLMAALPGLVDRLEVRQWRHGDDPAAARYCAGWSPPPLLLRGVPRLELMISVGAGIDHIDRDALPPDAALVRLVDPDLTRQVVEYATMAVLALHRDLPAYVAAQAGRRWAPRRAVPAAARRRVGVLGLGEIGGGVARALAALDFPVSGWSRGLRTMAGIACHHGADGLGRLLAGTDILICALPLTDATRGILNADLFARLPRGAMLLNIGRGAHLDEAALLAALDAGHVAAAMLDVMAVEPLPHDHPLWTHPGVLLTPHVAGASEYDAVTRACAAAIHAHRGGRPIPGRVDPARGY